MSSKMEGDRGREPGGTGAGEGGKREQELQRHSFVVY